MQGRIPLATLVLMSWLASAGPAPAETARVPLTAAPLADAGVVLSPASFNQANRKRPILYYSAYGAEVILPRHRLVFSPDKPRQSFKLGPVGCTIAHQGGQKFTLTAGGASRPMKLAKLGYEPVSIPLPPNRQYLMAFPRAFAFAGQSTLFRRSGAVQTGTVGPQHVALYDDNLDGLYTKGADAACIGAPGKACVFAAVADLLPTAERVWQVKEIAADGSAMTLDAYSGPAGRLAIELAVKGVECRAAFASADGRCTLAMASGGKGLAVPAGTYRFLYGLLVRPATGRVAALVLPGSVPVVVAADQTVTLTLGELAGPKLAPAARAVTCTFDELLQINLEPVEQACQAGQFDQALELFRQVTGKVKLGPNHQATRSWIESLGRTLELETSPEGAALRSAEGKVLAAARKGDLPAAKALLGEARKAFEALPARFVTYRAYRLHKARSAALGRYADGALPGLWLTFFEEHRFRRVTQRKIVERVDWKEHPTGAGRRMFFSCRYRGSLLVVDEGPYELFLASDNGARLWLDRKMVIDHWQSHTLAEKSVRLKLTAGLHPLRIEMYQALGGAALHLRWRPPGGRKCLVPPWALECRPDSPDKQP